MTVETIKARPIMERLFEITAEFQKTTTEKPEHIYFGEEEYKALRLEVAYAAPYLGHVPLAEDYVQGSFQVLGVRLFLLRDVPSHLAVA